LIHAPIGGNAQRFVPADWQFELRATGSSGQE
jgi:hypothetical protein